VTPPELPWRRSADLTGEGDGAAGSPPPERSLWAKAGLLDATPEPDTATDQREPDANRRTAVPDSSITPAERHALLLDRHDPTPEESATGADGTDRPADELPSDVGDDHLRYDIHEQKSVEILDRERPLVDRVARVIDHYLDRISPQAWYDASLDDRGDAIRAMGRDIRHAMHLPAVTVTPVDFELCGLHYTDKGHHYIEVARDMNLKSTLSTVAHEMRHAYQVEIIDGRAGSHEDSSSWTHNQHEYVEYDDDDDNIDAYYTQPLEADAFGFERAVGKTLGQDWPEL
jgi:hypothetical protein